MLTHEENEKLSRVGSGTPMGELVRRFWIPFLLSSDLPVNDSDPVRVKLLGESLLAFRDTSGQVGLVDTQCPHRRANLFFGRNEEGGIRCTYHGWKFDVEGRCLETPTEPAESTFAGKIQLKAYEVLERAGVLWAYMGPKSSMPELPDFEWMRAPETNRHSSWSIQENNFVQAIEGGIDTVHSLYLHSTLDSHRRLTEWKDRGRESKDPQLMFRTKDNPPRLFAKDTDYGVLIGGCYPGTDDVDYWRYNLFLMPFYTMAPGGGYNANQKLCHALVPLDDVTTARWAFNWSTRPYSSRELADMESGNGAHVAAIAGTHIPQRNKSNDYLIDREQQRRYTFTGINGVGEQDFSVQEGMGEIVDRSEEHLGLTDIGIIQMRRRLLKDATSLQEGTPPYAAQHGDVYRGRAGDALLPSGEDWVENDRTKEALAPVW